MSKIDLRNFKEEVTSSESDFFTLPVGDTKLRILTDFVEVKTLWEGEYPNSKSLGIVEGNPKVSAGQKVQSKGWAWATVKNVNGSEINEVRIIQFSMGLIGKIAKLKSDGDYAWEDMPMPFDITISNTGEGGNRYSITPARNNTPVSEKEEELLKKKKSLEDIVSAIVDKQSGKKVELSDSVDYPESTGEVAF